MAKKVGMGFIGVGGLGAGHVGVFMKDTRVTGAAVCDIDRKRAEAVAAQHGIPNVYTDVDDLVNDPAVDAVSISTPNFAHTPSAVAALKAGKHVSCEKPPAMNAAEARQAADAAKKSGCILMYALVMRYGGEAQYARKLVERGELGDIYYARCFYGRREGIPIGAGGWFVDKKRAGGGALIDLGVHGLDQTWYIMGCPRPVAASGAAFRKFEKEVPKQYTYDVDDSAFGFIRFETGAVLYLQTSWALHLPTPDIAAIAGNKAGLTLNPLTIYKRVNGTQMEVTPHPASVDAFAQEDKHFIDCILQKKKPVSDGEDGVMLMKMLDAIYASSEKGAEVAIC